MLQKLGGENACRGHFRRVVMFQDVIDLLPVIALGHRLRAESGSHSRHGTRVVVHAVILGADTLREGERQHYEDERKSFHQYLA
ncbi:hypothetical protein IMSAGC004_01264 [Bacteroidaceae bacterium]|nr:hypothetical protein IMSAGC004_01264 [Bacteroidaceae bacterium]